MKKLLVATTIASLVLAAPAARANEWGGLVGGLAGGLIAGAIVSSMQQPRMVYVPVRRHYVATRTPSVPNASDHPVVHTVVAPVPVAVPVPVAAPASAPANNNNIVVAPAPAPAPIIINNSPAPAPAPIIINTTSAPQAAPTSAVADRCQQDFQKTADYLACLKGIAPVAAN